MYFEEQTIRDTPKLTPSHPAFWLEDAIIIDANKKKKDLHDKEHEDMLIHWGCKPEHTSKLTIRKDDKGEYFADRLYHCMLHLKYWKEKGIHTHYVEKFEKQFNWNLDNLTLPQPSEKGEGFDY